MFDNRASIGESLAAMRALERLLRVRNMRPLMILVQALHHRLIRTLFAPKYPLLTRTRMKFVNVCLDIVLALQLSITVGTRKVGGCVVLVRVRLHCSSRRKPLRGIARCAHESEAFVARNDFGYVIDEHVLTNVTTRLKSLAAVMAFKVSRFFVRLQVGQHVVQLGKIFAAVLAN